MTTGLLTSIDTDPAVPTIEPGRLRSTWLLAQHVRALQLCRPSISVWQGWLTLAEWIEAGGKRRAHLRSFADRDVVRAAKAGLAAYWEGPEGHEAAMDRLFEDSLADWPGHRPQSEVL